MTDTISFYCTIHKFQGDKEGEAKLILVIEASDMEKVAAFYAKNYGKSLGCALTVDQSTEYKGTEENIVTGEIKEGE